MKTNSFTLIVAMLIIAVQSTIARPQNSYRVEAMRADISENLDLEAVATMFSYAKNLNDFERRLNDPRAAISNLDLNDDGYVDYLRVIKETDRYVDIIIIQAVLGNDFYQDVASIVVERNRNREAYIQIVGDVYIFGYDYIIEPVFYWNPPLIDWLWRNTRITWISPWYWNYYPRYYRYYRPVPAHVYYERVYHRINHKHIYHYDGYRNLDYRRSKDYYRHDWIDRYPDRKFDKRNIDVKNKKELKERTGNEAIRRSQGAGSRNSDVQRNNYGVQRSNDVQRNTDVQRNNGVQRSNEVQRNTDVQRNNGVQRSNEVQRNTDVQRNNGVQRSNEVQRNSNNQREDVQRNSRPVENRIERRSENSEPVRSIERPTERKVEPRIERKPEVRQAQPERKPEVRQAQPERKPEVRQAQPERRQEVKSSGETKSRNVKEAKSDTDERNGRR